MEQSSFHDAICEIANNMLELGELVLEQIKSSAPNSLSVAFAQLNQRDHHYTRLKSLTELRELQWAHIKAQDNVVDLSAAVRPKIQQSSREAFEALEKVLSQNSLLEQAIGQMRQRVLEQIQQIDQRRRLEQAYHPSNLAVGVWSQAR